MPHLRASALLLAALTLACESPVERPPAPSNDGIYSFANGCFAMDATAPGSNDTRWLEPTPTGDGYGFTARDLDSGSRFFLKPSDLGTYLFYDAEQRYLVAGDDGTLLRQAQLDSDILLLDDTFVSPAEWVLEVSAHDDSRFQLKNLRSGHYLTRDGFTESVDEAAVVALYPTNGCAEHPELTLDADGEVSRTQFDDGDLFGIADTHEHMFSNFGFGGGGIYHGSPFHRLGVEHALPDCTPFHGDGGRHDIFGYSFDQGRNADTQTLLEGVVSGRTPDFNHHTEGYPEFTDWPAAPFSATHQTMYYKWIQRAYLAGLRLMVQLATSNQPICDFMVGQNIQDVRYSCNDMVGIDREIEEVHNLERYIDAQEGGPGRGWFRIVTSPAEARDVIPQGKLAVILGIEVANLFDCFSVPRDGFPTCDADYVRSELDRYHEMGVRSIFPVHKYDNMFSAGDGDRTFIEVGNFVNSGQWSNFTLDCPTDVNVVFDHGDVHFGGLNMPRDDYLAPPPNDMSGFADDPLGTVLPFVRHLNSPALHGAYCQNAGLTALGETLMNEMMRRGMIIEIDHMNQRAYQRAMEILEAADYPPVCTHGTNAGGRVYALGGISKSGLGRCHDPANPGSTFNRFRDRVQLIADNGGYPAEGFGFDLNGFAGYPGPRFGDRSGCSTPQEDPITYPFTSYAGDVTFTEPQLGDRAVDFNTEGFTHIGMLPELIQDSRLDGVTDAELESVFRSAEAYIRMWERAEARAAAMP